MIGPVVHRARRALAILFARWSVALHAPAPKPGDGPHIADLVIADAKQLPSVPARARLLRDLADRKALGIARYGLALQANNGRDALTDFYEELLDAPNYARQYAEECRSLAVRRRFLRMERRALEFALEACAEAEARDRRPWRRR